MAVVEKQSTRYMSYAASTVGIVVCLYLYVAGMENPRKYVSAMAINHHAGYGGALACRQCHVPEGALGTSMTCMTAKCHWEVSPAVPREKAVELYMKYEKLSFRPDARERAEHHIDLHLLPGVKNVDCWKCHTEHTKRATTRPPGWLPYEESVKAKETSALPGGEWISIKDAGGDSAG